MMPSDLISPEYLETQKELHARPRGYGGKGDKWTTAVASLVWTLDATSVLDYGCGQGTLMKSLREVPRLEGVELREYDPAIKGKALLPSPADLVVCTDVLEHIEPAKLPCVLAHLQLLAKKAIFAVIATRPASKELSDGRNAHLIIEDADWWRATLHAAGFDLHLGPASPLRKPSRELVTVLTVRA